MGDVNARIAEVRNNLESLIELNETMHDRKITIEIIRLKKLLKKLEEEN